VNYLNTLLADIFTGKNFYLGAGIVVFIFLITFFLPGLLIIGWLAFLIFAILLMTDYLLLFVTNKEVTATRDVPSRLSNGEVNQVKWTVRNNFNFPVYVELMDEWPEQFQIRNYKIRINLGRLQQVKLSEAFRPVKRGEYNFGDIHLFVNSPIGMFSRRFTDESEMNIACYPSFTHLSQYSLNSDSTMKNEQGSKRMRKIGQSLEFEQIKEYVSGDDIRRLNWKATARRGNLMINKYSEERAQQVYLIIDKGRLMKMPFDNMTLLDYAINSALILSSICIRKKDKTGLITFSDKIDAVLPADNRISQLKDIMEALYKQETDFVESDFEKLYSTVRGKIKNRSLLILFTNFESISGLQRQIGYFRSLSKYYLLTVVFFENSELKSLIKLPAQKVEQVYVKTIAEKYAFEKKLIAKELTKYGIITILSSPEELTIKTINKYLELKVKQAL